MSNSVFLNKIISQASKNMLRVKKIDNSITPYTLLGKYDATQTEKPGYVTLHNLIAGKTEDVPLNDIDSFIIERENISENIKHEHTFIQYCTKAYNLFLETKLPNNIFYKNFMNSIVIDNNIQQAVIDFNFLINEDMIKGKNIEEELLEDIKNSFLNIIDTKVNENKKELIQLKDECETEEDEEDIDQIIEMFDSCKEEICLDNAQTITDILNEWPPLLLPLPESIDRLLNLEIVEIEEKTKLEQFKDLITNLDANILYEFNQILDNAKEILDESIYNEYKTVIDAEYYKKFDENL